MGATFYKEKGFFLLKEEDISLEKKRGCDSEAWKGLQIFFNGENPHGTFCSLHAPGSTERGCHLARGWKNTRSLWRKGTHSEGKGGTISWKFTAHTVGGYSPRRHAPKTGHFGGSLQTVHNHIHFIYRLQFRFIKPWQKVLKDTDSLCTLSGACAVCFQDNHHFDFHVGILEGEF